MRFAEKDATVRYVAGKVTLDQILKRYENTPFAVVPTSPIVSVARVRTLTLRGWTARAMAADASTESNDRESKTTNDSTTLPIELFVEVVPNKSLDESDKPQFSFSDPPLTELALLDDFQETPLAEKSTERAINYGARLTEAVELRPGELIVPVAYTIAANEENGKVDGKLNVVLRTIRKPASVMRATGVALIGGSLELRLGHLCDQKGCVEHFHGSLHEIPGLGAMLPRPSLDEPRATVYLRARHAIDIWGLHQKLRDQGVEVTSIVPRDLDNYQVRVELPRFVVDEKTGEAEQCLECRDKTFQAIERASWAKQAIVSGGGIHFQPSRSGFDLSECLRVMTNAGVAPQAVWLVPDGVPVPKSSPPHKSVPRAGPVSGGSFVHPVVEFDVAHTCNVGADMVTLLSQQSWAVRTDHDQTNSTTTLAAIGDRKYAGLTPVLHELRANGQTVQQIRLREFGDIRIQLEFAHICGEVEYSKPPKPKKKPKQKDADKETDSANDPAKKKADESAPAEAKPDENKPGEKKAEPKPAKPFVPQPLRPLPTSNGRQAIEAAINSVEWIKDGVFEDYHSKPEFRGGPTKITITFQTKGDDVVRLDELITALRKAGFPPTSVTVSRCFSGLPFAKPMPGDLQLSSGNDQEQSLASFKKPDRPLVVAFVSLKCKRYEKYAANPKLYADFSKTVDQYKDRVDFVAISANGDDKFPDVVEFWNKTGVPISLLHDSSGAISGALNAQATPPPHIYVFDGEGLFRYAGEPHDRWEKADEKKEDFLAKALDLVLAKKYEANGAVFFNKSLCNCSDPRCKCPKCGCGSSCRCLIKH